MVLFPPNTPPTPTPRPPKRHLEELTTSTWEEDNSVRPRDSPRPQTTPVQAPTPLSNQKAEAQASSPQPKWRRPDNKNGKGLPGTQTLKELSLSQSGFMGNTMRGTGTLNPDNVVMTYPEILDVAHDFAAHL